VQTIVQNNSLCVFDYVISPSHTLRRKVKKGRTVYEHLGDREWAEIDEVTAARIVIKEYERRQVEDHG
jgi:hypothetical protein